MQREKTALPTHARRQVSSPTQDPGLIVTAKNARRSARTTRAVDNRSHRTPKFTCGRIKQNASEASLPKIARQVQSTFGCCSKMPTEAPRAVCNR